ncbi:DUF1716-domain-containing protein [Xylariaceae sp. FL0804]|nr:DUF1716-domain-containing protein [Xylariaceae sp. FL0804]
MTSIDEIFKASGVTNKRKLEPLKDPNQIYKSARLTPDGRSSRQARVEDEPTNDGNGDGDDDDTIAGPDRPPAEGDDEGDYGPDLPPDDDEEGGRFFGGGVTAQEAEVLDYLDGNDDATAAAAAPEQRFDSAWLRRTALSFERKISRNAEQRAKFESEPARFIGSEAELDGEIKGLSILAEHPDLYAEFARLGCAASLVGLLAHENTDIAVDAVEILNELTDEDVAAADDQWGALVAALLDADLLGLLASNLERLDEARQEVDRAGVYYALSILESLSGRAATAERVAAHDQMLAWLLRRIQTVDGGEEEEGKEGQQRYPGGVSQNRQYAAEVLAILVQGSRANRRRLADRDAADTLLQLVAPYRRRDPPRGADEEEYMENLFEALTCLADEPAGKARFVAAEGVELCLLMLRGEGRRVRAAALRLLDHACAGPAAAATEVCVRVVEAGGLKNLFTLFMGGGDGGDKKKKQKKKQHHVVVDDAATTEHLLGIFASLLRRLPAGSPERVRALAKFVERDYAKTARLVALRRDYAARLAAADEAMRAERLSSLPNKGQGEEDEDEEDEGERFFSRRLDAGLFALRTLDVVLAWLAAEDDGARAAVARLLAERGESLRVVRDSVREQMEGIVVVDDAEGKEAGEGGGGNNDDDDNDDDDDAAAAAAEGRDTREMLATLAQFLQ